MVQEMARFVNKSVLTYQEYALSHHFVDGATFGMYTSSIAESSHGSNKLPVPTRLDAALAIPSTSLCEK